MSLVLVRHGRTTMNAEGRLLGRLDPPLDVVGEAQAAAAGDAVAAMLRDSASVRVVSSPLARTRATAAVVAAALGVEVEVDEGWIEIDYGGFDGLKLDEVPAETWAAWRRDLDFRPPDGESIADLGRRVRATCDALVPAASDGDVVVVSHVSPIKAAVAWALAAGDEIAWRLYLAPGSITRIGVSNRGVTLQEYNRVPDGGAR